MELLKPCPFCGENTGAVRLRNMYVPNDRNSFVEEYEAVCINCGANTGKVYRSFFVRRNGEFVFSKDGYADAAAGWNRREVPEDTKNNQGGERDDQDKNGGDCGGVR